jgi:hypothetical protein
MTQRIQSVQPSIPAEEPPALAQTIAELRAMQEWQPGWNGYDALPPCPDAISHAISWIHSLYDVAGDAGRAWIIPYVTASANGEVVFEWWRGSRKLTVYVSGGTAEYVQVWGPDIVHEMADGEGASVANCRRLWLWLTD